MILGLSIDMSTVGFFFVGWVVIETEDGGYVCLLVLDLPVPVAANKLSLIPLAIVDGRFTKKEIYLYRILISRRIAYIADSGWFGTTSHSRHGNVLPAQSGFV